MFFSLFRQRERTKRDHVARFRLDKISILRTVLRDSLRSNRSSHRLQRRTQSSYFIANLLAIATPYTLRGGIPRYVVSPYRANHNSTLYTTSYE